MSKSKVYFSNFRTEPFGMGLTGKLQKMIRIAGIEDLDMEKKFVAVKMHFGEMGNLSFLRPNYARALVDVIKEYGGIPFLTDCNTMYVGSRKNAIEHLDCAWLNGFTPYTVGCPIIIADGLKGTDDVEVPVEGGVMVKNAKIGRAVMDADIVISLSHFKGHELAGFGGAIKNLGMGCGSRAGKKEMHSNGKAVVEEGLCRGCRKCQKQCANKGLVFDETKKKMSVNSDNCVGCGRCLGACNYDAISFRMGGAVKDLNIKMAEYAKAVCDGRPNFHISLIVDVSPCCDCHCENDAAILPNIGMFCSFDPIALDQACADACQKAKPLSGSRLYENIHRADFVDQGDCFRNNYPEAEWKSCLQHGVEIGLGSRDYELIEI